VDADSQRMQASMQLSPVFSCLCPSCPESVEGNVPKNDDLSYVLVPEQPLAVLSSWYYEITIPLRGADRHAIYDEAERFLVVMNDDFHFTITRLAAPEDRIHVRWSAAANRPDHCTEWLYSHVREKMVEALKNLKDMLEYLHPSKSS
jgi:hypothetical protein